MFSEPRALAQLSRSALVHNFRVLRKLTRAEGLLPMVKANAYGHGSAWVTQILDREFKKSQDLRGFGVATVSEALEIRPYTSKSILVFSDGKSWTRELVHFYLKQGLEPVLSEQFSLREFLKVRGSLKLPFHVEVNTGMNRLGVSIESALKLGAIKAQEAPQSVFTHLAQSEDPHCKVTTNQMKAWKDLVLRLREKLPACEFHFANSSAIVRDRDYKMPVRMSFARPGLSLYGIRPFERAPENGLKRVMTLSAPVIRNEKINKGDSVGYSAGYVCKKTSGEWVATVAAGYADGVFRSMGNSGEIILSGKSNKRCKILGRVSMDLTAIESSSLVKIGDRMIWWGQELDPYRVAHSAGTIPYEITTRVGARVEREEV